MASDYVGVRMLPEMRAHAEQLAEQQGMSLSEWLRILIHNAITGELPNVDDAYRSARGIAIQLAHTLISNAVRDLPDTYEEAVARYQMGGPGRSPTPGGPGRT